MDQFVYTHNRHEPSLLETSNLGFSTLFEDHASVSSTSLEEPNDQFDQDEDVEAETKYLPMQRQLNRMFGMDDEWDDSEDVPTISDSSDKALEMSPSSSQTSLPTTIMNGKSSIPSNELLSESTGKKQKIPQDKTQLAMYQRRRKNIFNVFPWLSEVEKMYLQCMGSIFELQSISVLESVDFLINKLTDSRHEYYKSPKVASGLAGYLRTFLCIYRELYRTFELGEEYFRRTTKLLAIYIDSELCSSVLGQELDEDIATRVLLLMQIHLEMADKCIMLDVFINMKRICRGHRGILSLILSHYLIDVDVQEPHELDDDLFIKYLVVYKKWLSIEELMFEKQKIRAAFLGQVKPKRTLCQNKWYAPYLPPDEEGSPTIDNYIRMLDKKYSLQPLICALDIGQRRESTYGDQSAIMMHESTEIVVLSDDEEEKSKEVIIKTEPVDVHELPTTELTGNGNIPEDVIDLTDEDLEATLSSHCIPWLPELIEFAQSEAAADNPHSAAAATSDDVIVIDDDAESVSAASVPKSTSTSSTIIAPLLAKVSSSNSPSTDSGCEFMSCEEVGINSNINSDTSHCLSNAGVDDEEVLISDAIVYENTAGDIDSGSGSVSINRNIDIDDSVAGSSSSSSYMAADKMMTVASNPNEMETSKYTDSLVNSERSNNSSSRLPLAEVCVIESVGSSVNAVDSANIVEMAGEETDPSTSQNRRTLLNSVHSDNDGDEYSGNSGNSSAHLEHIAKKTRSQMKELQQKNIDENSSVWPSVNASKNINSTMPTSNELSSDWFCDNADVTHYQSNCVPTRISCPVTSNNSNIRSLEQQYRSGSLEILDSDTDVASSDESATIGSSRAMAVAGSRMTKFSDGRAQRRPVRFADDVAIADPNEYAHHGSEFQMRLMKNTDETIPSTIQERKTYIKPATLNLFNQGYMHSSSRMKSRSPPPPVQQQPRSRSPANAMMAISGISRMAEQQTYRVFCSDCNASHETPYESVVPRSPSERCTHYMNGSPVWSKRPATRQPMPQTLYRRINGCFVEADLLDTKLFSSKVQIADISHDNSFAKTKHATVANRNATNKYCGPRSSTSCLAIGKDKSSRNDGIKINRKYEAYGNDTEMETDFEHELERQNVAKKYKLTRSKRSLKGKERPVADETGTDSEYEGPNFRYPTRSRANMSSPYSIDSHRRQAMNEIERGAESEPDIRRIVVKTGKDKSSRNDGIEIYRKYEAFGNVTETETDSEHELERQNGVKKYKFTRSERSLKGEERPVADETGTDGEYEGPNLRYLTRSRANMSSQYSIDSHRRQAMNEIERGAESKPDIRRIDMNKNETNYKKSSRKRNNRGTCEAVAKRTSKASYRNNFESGTDAGTFSKAEMRQTVYKGRGRSRQRCSSNLDADVTVRGTECGYSGVETDTDAGAISEIEIGTAVRKRRGRSRKQFAAASEPCTGYSKVATNTVADTCSDIGTGARKCRDRQRMMDSIAHKINQSSIVETNQPQKKNHENPTMNNEENDISENTKSFSLHSKAQKKSNADNQHGTLTNEVILASTSTPATTQGQQSLMDPFKLAQTSGKAIHTKGRSLKTYTKNCLKKSIPNSRTISEADASDNILIMYESNRFDNVIDQSSRPTSSERLDQNSPLQTYAQFDQSLLTKSENVSESSTKQKSLSSAPKMKSRTQPSGKFSIKLPPMNKKKRGRKLSEHNSTSINLDSGSFINESQADSFDSTQSSHNQDSMLVHFDENSVLYDIPTPVKVRGRPRAKPAKEDNVPISIENRSSLAISTVHTATYSDIKLRQKCVVVLRKILPTKASFLKRSKSEVELNLNEKKLPKCLRRFSTFDILNIAENRYYREVKITEPSILRTELKRIASPRKPRKVRRGKHTQIVMQQNRTRDVLDSDEFVCFADFEKLRKEFTKFPLQTSIVNEGPIFITDSADSTDTLISLEAEANGKNITEQAACGENDLIGENSPATIDADVDPGPVILAMTLHEQEQLLTVIRSTGNSVLIEEKNAVATLTTNVDIFDPHVPSPIPEKNLDHYDDTQVDSILPTHEPHMMECSDTPNIVSIQIRDDENNTVSKETPIPNDITSEVPSTVPCEQESSINNHTDVAGQQTYDIPKIIVSVELHRVNMSNIGLPKKSPPADTSFGSKDDSNVKKKRRKMKEMARKKARNNHPIDQKLHEDQGNTTLAFRRKEKASHFLPNDHQRRRRKVPSKGERQIRPSYIDMLKRNCSRSSNDEPEPSIPLSDSEYEREGNYPLPKIAFSPRRGGFYEIRP